MQKKDDYRKLISRLYAKLGRKKKKIADVLLDKPVHVLEKNARELAEFCGCDQTTMVRFAQQLGYAGYSELKLAVARQSGALWQNYEGEKETDGGFRGLCGRLLQLHSETIKETLNGAKQETMSELVKKISAAKKVMICGAGSSHLAAQDLNVKLMRQGINTICFADHELWKTFIGYLDQDDVLMLFSHSGETAEILKLAQAAHERGIYVAAVTGFEGSSLARLANGLFLTACRGEHSIRLGAMSSRIAQSVMVDLITISLSIRDKNRAWNFLEKSYGLVN